MDIKDADYSLKEDLQMLKQRLLSIFFALFIIVGISACDSGGGSDDTGNDSDELVSRIINDYVDIVVICTYDDLRIKAIALKDAVDELLDDPTEENLEAARDAWIAARIPWEQSEAWLFGPVDFNGFDPALDSWPVNRTDLQAVLDGSDDLTEQFIANLDPLLKGFHTIEFILFDFEIEELGEREFEYLVGTAADVETTAIALYESWAIGPDPFGDLMKDAGNNTAFPSQTSALEQIVEGMSIILDEVANGKIADPFDNQDVEAVESQFSFNSRADFANDIVGVLNAYLGDNPDLGKFGAGLVEFIAETDPVLAQQVEDEIQAGIDAILAIPQPFRDAISDPDAEDEIIAAQNALNQVFATLNGPVLDIIQQ